MQHEPVMTEDDVAVTLAVRRDLGVEHDPAVIAEFLDRVGTSIDKRVDERLASARLPQGGGPRNRDLPVVSLVLGIPITAIASSDGVTAMAIAWAGIALVNVADALRR